MNFEHSVVASGAVDASFTHVRLIIGMVLGLAISKLLLGLVKLIRRPAKTVGCLIHVGWVLYAFLAVIEFWWFEFSLRHLQVWSFSTYLFLILYAALHFLLCALLFPDDSEREVIYRDYFLGQRRWFFMVLIALMVADLMDTLIKGWGHYLGYGIEYSVHIVIAIVMSLIAIRTRKIWFHTVFVCLALAYQIYFAARYLMVLS